MLIFPPQAAMLDQINELDWEHIDNEVEMEIAQQAPPQPPQAQPELVDPPLQLPLNLENL